MAKNRRHNRSSFGHSSFLRVSSFGFRHLTTFLIPVDSRVSAVASAKADNSWDNHAPLFDFSSSAALIAARTPSGFLFLGSTGWLLMKNVGVIVTPRESPRA